MCAAVALDQCFGKWHVKSEIDEGSYGKVYRVVHQDRQVEAAAKVVLSTNSVIATRPEFFYPLFKAEAANLAKVKELGVPNATILFECIDNFTTLKEWQIVTVMEFFPGKCLDELFIMSGRRITLEECCTLLEKGLPTLSFLEKRGLLHGDLSPNNILLDGENIRFIDWTTLRNVDNPYPERPTSLRVASPEMILLAVWGPPADVFSFAASIISACRGLWLGAGIRVNNTHTVLSNYEFILDEHIPQSLIKEGKIRKECFDMGFHRATGEVGYRLKLPRKVEQHMKLDIRRIAGQDQPLGNKLADLLEKMTRLDPDVRIKASSAYDEMCEILGGAAV